MQGRQEGPNSVGRLRLEGGGGGARLCVIEEGGRLLQDELQLDQLAEAARQALRIAVHLQQLAFQLLQPALQSYDRHHTLNNALLWRQQHRHTIHGMAIGCSQTARCGIRY